MKKDLAFPPAIQIVLVIVGLLVLACLLELWVEHDTKVATVEPAKIEPAKIEIQNFPNAQIWRGKIMEGVKATRQHDCVTVFVENPSDDRDHPFKNFPVIIEFRGVVGPWERINEDILPGMEIFFTVSLVPNMKPGFPNLITMAPSEPKNVGYEAQYFVRSDLIVNPKSKPKK